MRPRSCSRSFTEQMAVAATRDPKLMADVRISGSAGTPPVFLDACCSLLSQHVVGFSEKLAQERRKLRGQIFLGRGWHVCAHPRPRPVRVGYLLNSEQRNPLVTVLVGLPLVGYSALDCTSRFSRRWCLTPLALCMDLFSG